MKTNNLDNVSSIRIAKIIDLVNEHLIKYFSRENEDKPTQCNIETLVGKKFGDISSIQIELIMNLMEHQGYCVAQTDDNKIITEYYYTNKGLSLFFNGGLVKEIRKKNNEKSLIIFGRISVILAGLYYLIEIILTIRNYICN